MRMLDAALTDAARSGPLVVAVVALLVAVLSTRHATSWHFFHDAAHLLWAPGAADGGGLDLYLVHPEFQFGPLAVLVAAPFALLPASSGAWAAVVFATLLGAAATVAVEVTIRSSANHRHATGTRQGRLVGELAFAIVWADVAVRTAHLDDAIALTAAAFACAAIARDRWGLTTLALTVAVAAKPWAVVFVPLALVPSGRHPYSRVGVVLAGALATWLPFIADEPHTVTAAGSFTITNAPASALRVLGVVDPSTPAWVRPTQFVAGLLVTVALVRAGRWRAVVMAGLAVRFMLDPGTHNYYAAGLVLGVLLWEGGARPGRLPLVTVATALVMEITPAGVHPAALGGLLRLALTIGLLAAAWSAQHLERPGPDLWRSRPGWPHRPAARHTPRRP